jgi:hypothetical protein
MWHPGVSRTVLVLRCFTGALLVSSAGCSSNPTRSSAISYVAVPATNPFAKLSSKVPKDPGFVSESPAVTGTPGPIVFELERRASLRAGWRLRVETTGAVWRSNLPREISENPPCVRVGHVLPAVLAQMSSLTTFALIGAPKTGAKGCSDCGTASAFVYWQPGMQKSRVLIARSGSETIFPASDSADTVAGWLFALQSVAPPIDGEQYPLR